MHTILANYLYFILAILFQKCSKIFLKTFQLCVENTGNTFRKQKWQNSPVTHVYSLLGICKYSNTKYYWKKFGKYVLRKLIFQKVHRPKECPLLMKHTSASEALGRQKHISSSSCHCVWVCIWHVCVCM